MHWSNLQHGKDLTNSLILFLTFQSSLHWSLFFKWCNLQLLVLAFILHNNNLTGADNFQYGFLQCYINLYQGFLLSFLLIFYNIIMNYNNSIFFSMADTFLDVKRVSSDEFIRIWSNLPIRSNLTKFDQNSTKFDCQTKGIQLSLIMIWLKTVFVQKRI